MDQRLIPADPDVVRRLMASAYLGSPAIAEVQGEVRLAAHQVDAASRIVDLLDQRGGAVLADATGLGKTFVALAVARSRAPTLVVAPAALRGMWQKSLGRTGVAAAILSYEALSRGQPPGPGPSLLVLDEAHHARNPGTRRYAALADLAWGARVLLLTATPIHNRSRDLRSLVALFLGSGAGRMAMDELLQLVVRRTPAEASADRKLTLPVLRGPRWLTVPGDPETLSAIVDLPEPAPVAGGAPAHALMVLGLIRAWSSSEAALRETLRRRLRRAASLSAALESGQFPSRRELASWPVVDDAVQLGLAGLFETPDECRHDLQRIRAMLDEHVEGVRRILSRLERNTGSADLARQACIRAVTQERPSTPAVAFTQFADTAVATFRRCAPEGGVALVTGRGARVSAGHVTVDEIVRGFDEVPDENAQRSMPLRLLIATDVLSEGLSLRRAGVLIHLDLPWTIARLEQRVGRLRRPGSRHAEIQVYAIGPPAGARELVPVVRALQRKARLSSAIAGRSELAASMPLLGQRFASAIGAMHRDGASLVEQLRGVMRQWLANTNSSRSAPAKRAAAIVLIARGRERRLFAVDDAGATENPGRILDAAKCLGSATHSSAPGQCDTALAMVIDRWLAEQHGRALARLATEAPSAGHTAVLQALQDRLRRAARLERNALGTRIERCRRLVMAARGIGAERALRAFGQPDLDLDALERLLASRTTADHLPTEPPLVTAVLSFDDRNGLGAWVSERGEP